MIHGKYMMCKSHQLHGNYYYGCSDSGGRSGQLVLMQKICWDLRTVKDLLRACHLNTETSEKTGPLAISLKNVLENFKVYWSQITASP